MDARLNDIIAWDVVPLADGYDVEVQNLGGTILNTVSLSSDTFILVADAVQGTVQVDGDFKVRVRAVDDAAGPGEWSAFLLLKLKGLPAPGNLRIQV